MINIDFLTLKAFLTENIDYIIGARLQKIQQPTRKDFLLTLRNNNISRKLYININPQFYHIAFISKENETKREIQIPQKPPMFCMQLRKYLDGARIADALVIDNERIFEIHFESYDELKQKKVLCLALELMGKHSNLILYDKDTNIILGCAHNVGVEKSRYRELKGGLKYIYPPKSKFQLSNELKTEFNGLSENQIKHYLTTEEYRPAINGDRYTLFQELIPNSIPQDSVSDMLDNYYANYQFKLTLTADKNRLKELVLNRLKKINNSITKIKTIINTSIHSEQYQKYGELLTANLYLKADYQSSISLYDYSTNKNINIEMDNTQTMTDNAQRYFKLYNKTKIRKIKSIEMLNQLNVKKEYWESLLYSIEQATNLEEIKIELGLTTEKKTKQKIISVDKVVINDFDVYIGKNNKQNEYIITKLAKDNDYWFHIHNAAGSHVLLKVNKKEPDESTIFECCKIAKLYSTAKMPSKVGIIYTKAKYLRKPPSTPLGYVTYKNETEILV